MREDIKTLDSHSFPEIENKIKEYKAMGYTNLSLSGGEATLRPDILDIIRSAEKIGFEKIILKTNGRRLSDENFTKDLSGIKNLEIIFSINGHTAPIHEAITGSNGSFEETVRGLKNAIKYGIPVRVNIVVCLPNYEYLCEIADFLVSHGVRDMQFCFVHPAGEAINHLDSMIIKIQDTVPYINAVLNKNSGEIHIRSIAYPFCLLSYENRQYTVERTGEEGEIFSKVKPEGCGECHYSKTCPGIWKSYYELYEFIPKPIK